MGEVTSCKMCWVGKQGGEKRVAYAVSLVMHGSALSVQCLSLWSRALIIFLTLECFFSTSETLTMALVLKQGGQPDTSPTLGLYHLCYIDAILGGYPIILPMENVSFCL